MVEPEPVLGGTLRLGFNWRLGSGYLRLAGGPGLGETLANSRAWEAVAAGGWAPARWLQVGVRGGVRFGSSKWDAIWADWAWFAGLESTQCGPAMVGSWRLCMTEAVSPVGRLVRRWQMIDGELDHGEILRQDLLVLSVGVTLQHPL